MLLRLFLLFTILPSFELWLLFQVKDQIGLLETIWLVVLTGIIGASMAKTQGLMVLQELQQQSQKRHPTDSDDCRRCTGLDWGCVASSHQVILTDAFGFSLIIPFTRRLWAPAVHGLERVTGLANGCHHGQCIFPVQHVWRIQQSPI